jgi:hypothetical protein
MALEHLLNLSYSKNQKKIGISEERLHKIKPALR